MPGSVAVLAIEGNATTLPGVDCDADESAVLESYPVAPMLDAMRSRVSLEVELVREGSSTSELGFVGFGENLSTLAEVMLKV